jgi:hypothetical protein
VNKPVEDPQPIQLDSEFRIHGLPKEFQLDSELAEGTEAELNHIRSAFTTV